MIRNGELNVSASSTILPEDNNPNFVPVLRYNSRRIGNERLRGFSIGPPPPRDHTN